MNKFSVDCSCGRAVEFDRYTDPMLDEYIGEQVQESQRDTRSEVTEEFEGFVDPENLIPDARHLFELSAAIRRGDRAEAEHLLDGVARELGRNAIEQVEQGRFSSPAKRAA